MVDSANFQVFEKSLTSGSSELYSEFADEYEEFFSSINTKAQENLAREWRKYHPNVENTTPSFKLFDAGCGTGLAAYEILKLLDHNNVEMYGGDLTPNMLEKAKQKSIYCDLRIVNLQEELPYEPEFFDTVVSSMAFTLGHCGPECLPNIVRVLKKNCYFVTTVRKDFYEQTGHEWKLQIKECGCQLVDETEIQYHDLAKGFVLVIQKH